MGAFSVGILADRLQPVSSPLPIPFSIPIHISFDVHGSDSAVAVADYTPLAIAVAVTVAITAIFANFTAIGPLIHLPHHLTANTFLQFRQF